MGNKKRVNNECINQNSWLFSGRSATQTQDCIQSTGRRCVCQTESYPPVVWVRSSFLQCFLVQLRQHPTAEKFIVKVEVRIAWPVRAIGDISHLNLRRLASRHLAHPSMAGALVRLIRFSVLATVSIASHFQIDLSSLFSKV